MLEYAAQRLDVRHLPADCAELHLVSAVPHLSRTCEMSGQMRSGSFESNIRIQNNVLAADTSIACIRGLLTGDDTQDCVDAQSMHLPLHSCSFLVTHYKYSIDTAARHWLPCHITLCMQQLHLSHIRYKMEHGSQCRRPLTLYSNCTSDLFSTRRYPFGS